VGTIVIDPFCSENLSTSSYDVTLGRFYFRELRPEPGMAIYNPYSQSHVERVWGQALEAERASDWVKRTGTKLENIGPDDRIIWISPGETILGHTIEWLGGRGTVTTMMKARSSMGRNFIEVCKCAGWGDVGYVNRWTMEITNNSRYYSIPLVVGRRIAQIVFFDTDGTLNGGCYTDKGKYQVTRDVEQMKLRWRPTDCLPKMYKDREILEGPILDPYPVTEGSFSRSSTLSADALLSTAHTKKTSKDLGPEVRDSSFLSPLSTSSTKNLKKRKQKGPTHRSHDLERDEVDEALTPPRSESQQQQKLSGSHSNHTHHPNKRVHSLQLEGTVTSLLCDSPFSQSSVSSPSSPNSVASHHP